MATIGIIGGTALNDIDVEGKRKQLKTTSEYGTTSSPLYRRDLKGLEVIFLNRHGMEHIIAPHKINYRANIDAMRQQGVTHVLAIAAVGGITEHMAPTTLVTPDQVIDYTHSRQATFYEDGKEVNHVDFTWPYDISINGLLNESAVRLNLPFVSRGTYAAVQGPRLETAAEILKLERDGCDIVGMTGMPEAVLAREAGMRYSCIAVVVNRAAGKRNKDEITMEEIRRNIATGMEHVNALLKDALPGIDSLADG